jgi:hypothetical protein
MRSHHDEQIAPLPLTQALFGPPLTARLVTRGDTIAPRIRAAKRKRRIAALGKMTNAPGVRQVSNQITDLSG